MGPASGATSDGGDVWPPPIPQELPPASPLTTAERRNFRARWSCTVAASLAAYLAMAYFPSDLVFHTWRDASYCLGNAALTIWFARLAVQGWSVFLRLRRERNLRV